MAGIDGARRGGDPGEPAGRGRPGEPARRFPSSPSSPSRSGLARPAVVSLQDADRAELRALRLRQPAGAGCAVRSGRALGALRSSWPRPTRCCAASTSRASTASATSPRRASCPRPTSTPARPPRRSGPSGPTAGSTAAPPRSATPRTGSGRFFPEIARDEAAIAALAGRGARSPSRPATAARWRRSAAAAAAPSPGGRTATPLAPDCRPVAELYGLGARYYGLDA